MEVNGMLTADEVLLQCKASTSGWWITPWNYTVFLLWLHFYINDKFTKKLHSCLNIYTVINAIPEVSIILL